LPTSPNATQRAPLLSRTSTDEPPAKRAPKKSTHDKMTTKAPAVDARSTRPTARVRRVVSDDDDDNEEIVLD